MIWSPIDIAETLHTLGVRGRDNRQTFVAVCAAETAGSFDEKAFHVNNDEFASVDRGLMMINSHWHAEVTDECAFDGACNLKEAVRIYRERGNQFTAWNAFKNNLHLKYMREAGVAVEAALRARIAADNLEACEIRTADAEMELAETRAQLNAVSVELANSTAENTKLRGIVDRFNAWVAEIRGDT